MNVWDSSHWTGARAGGPPAGPAPLADGAGKAGDAAVEMARQAAAFMGRRFGSYASACEEMSRARSPAELIEIQQKWMRTCFSDYAGLVGRTGELLRSTGVPPAEVAPPETNTEGAPHR